METAMSMSTKQIESKDEGVKLIKKAAQIKILVASGCAVVVSKKEALYVVESAFGDRSSFVLHADTTLIAMGILFLISDAVLKA